MGSWISKELFYWEDPLGHDLWMEILGMLDENELARAQRVCRGWREMASADMLWKRHCIAVGIKHCEVEGSWRRTYLKCCPSLLIRRNPPPIFKEGGTIPTIPQPGHSLLFVGKLENSDVFESYSPNTSTAKYPSFVADMVCPTWRGQPRIATTLCCEIGCKSNWMYYFPAHDWEGYHNGMFGRPRMHELDRVASRYSSFVFYYCSKDPSSIDYLEEQLAMAHNDASVDEFTFEERFSSKDVYQLTVQKRTIPFIQKPIVLWDVAGVCPCKSDYMEQRVIDISRRLSCPIVTGDGEEVGRALAREFVRLNAWRDLQQVHVPRNTRVPVLHGTDKAWVRKMQKSTVRQATHTERERVCISGAHVKITLASGDTIALDRVRPNMSVLTDEGPACVVQVYSDQLGATVRAVALPTPAGDLILTRRHPVMNGGEWRHPEEICAPRRMFVDTFYNFELDRGHALYANGVLCATLGRDVGPRLIAKRPDLDKKYGRGYWTATWKDDGRRLHQHVS